MVKKREWIIPIIVFALFFVGVGTVIGYSMNLSEEVEQIRKEFEHQN